MIEIHRIEFTATGRDESEIYDKFMDLTYEIRNDKAVSDLKFECVDSDG